MSFSLDRIKLILLLLLGLWVRLVWTVLPPFQELNYEESLVGLMARHILNGEFIALWWGQPYGGTLEIYLLSIFFLIFGESVTVARLLPVCISLFGIFSVYLLGRTLFNVRVALRTALFLAVAPVFLLRLSIVPYSGYLTTLALGPFIILWTYNVLFRRQRINRIGWHYFGIGFFSGLLIWQHLIGASFFIASFLLLVLCERRFFLKPSFWIASFGFFVGLLPLIVWNISHDWGTFMAMISGHSSGHILSHIWQVIYADLPLLFAPNEKWAQPLFWVLYLPVALFLFFLGVRTMISLVQREKGDWEGSRFLAVYLFSAIFLMALTNYGLERYLFSVYATLPLLIVFFWSRLYKRFPKVASTAFILLIMLNASGTFFMAKAVSKQVPRPIESVLTFIKEKEISHVMGHYRVVWPIQFESKENITASDWNFFQDNPYYIKKIPVNMKSFFEMAKSVLKSNNVAYITHEGLKLPTASQFESVLNILKADYKKEKKGLYAIFYNVAALKPFYKEVEPSEFSLRSNLYEADLTYLVDGNLSTEWSTRHKQSSGDWIEINFKKPLSLTKILLNTRKNILNTPEQLVIEVSKNGRDWKEVIDASKGQLTADWFGQNVALNVKGDLSFYFSEEKIRSVRFKLKGDGRRPWSLSQIRLFEKSESLFSPWDESIFSEVEELIDLKSLQAFYAPKEALLLLREKLPKSCFVPQLFEPKHTPLEEQSYRVNFSLKNAFLVPDSSSVFMEEFFKEKNIPYSHYDLKKEFSLFETGSQSWVPNMIWSQARLLGYQSREESFASIIRGDLEWEQKHVGLAKKYYETSFIKYPNSFAYFRLKEVLKHLQDQEQLDEFEAKWKTAFEPSNQREEVFDGLVKLIGTILPPSIVKDGTSVKATCLFQCLQPMQRDYAVFVHFENSEGVLFQADHFPVQGSLPSSKWVKDEIIGDTFSINIPKNIPSGKYDIFIGLWEPYEIKKRLKVYDAKGNESGSRVKIGEIICENNRQK